MARHGAHARFCLVVAVFLTIGVIEGCGDNKHPAQQVDGGSDAPVPQDAAQSDLVASPTACTVEFTRCEDKDAGYCEKEGLDCVSVRVDTQARVCLRRCESTSDCPFNSYCVPSKVEWGGLSLAANHCFGSVCGAPYGNGELFGACNVGGDNLVSLSEGEQRPGTCVPVDTEQGTGVCAEAGSEASGGIAERDEVCSLDVRALGCPSRFEMVGCVPGTVCVGPACEPVGTCALLCDPRLDPEAQCVVPAGRPKQYCQDISLLTLGASGRLHLGYVGICQPFPRCRLFGSIEDGGVPAKGCGPTDGCYPTTMATTSGVCAPAGTKGVGETCRNMNECAQGLACVGKAACGEGTCRTLCPLPEGSARCGEGMTCVGVAMDPNQPLVVSRPWGVCVATDKETTGTPRFLAVRPWIGQR